MGRVFGKFQVLGFRGLLLLYVFALALFVGWISLNPSQLVILLGTFLFTVATAFLAMFRFSRDLERSTRDQIFTLQEATRTQLQEAERHAQRYVEALRESTERETRAFEENIGKTTACRTVMIWLLTSASLVNVPRRTFRQMSAMA